jgi:hypothetical protein
MQATQGYTFSGKQSSIDFLIMKSRGKARMLPCSLTAIGVNGRTLNFAEFFDKDGVRPNTISVGDWDIMSATAYDCILGCCSDGSCEKYISGIERRRLCRFEFQKKFFR